jgi:hypothetical protein
MHLTMEVPYRVSNNHGAADQTTDKNVASEESKGHKKTNQLESMAKKAHMTSSTGRFMKKKDSNSVLGILSLEPQRKTVILSKRALIGTFTSL